MTLIEKLQDISDYISGLNVITHYGGISIHYEDKEPTYGIGTTGNCKGNIYGYNSNEISGYLMLNEIVSAPLGNINRSSVKCRLYLYVPNKLIGNSVNTYEIPMFMQSKLAKKYLGKYDVTMNTLKIRRYPDFEITYLEIDFKHFGDCSDSLTLSDPIC